MIVAWKDGVSNEFTEECWDMLVNKNGWEKEPPKEKPNDIPVEVTEFMKGKYDDFNYGELKALAKEKGLTFGKGQPSKVKLIEALNAHTE